MTDRSGRSAIDRAVCAIASQKQIRLRVEPDGSLRVADPSRRGRQRRLSSNIVKALINEGLIASSGEAFVATPLARARLKRMLSGADGFADQHRRIEFRTFDPDDDPVPVNDAECPLAWLRKRRDGHGEALINDAEFAAGERLRSDFTRAQLMPNVTSNWSANAAIRGARLDGMGTFSDAVLTSKKHVSDALDAVGPEFADLIVDVCCFLKGLSEIERTRGWPARSAKVVLRLALARLARHYGFENMSDRRG